MLSGLAQTYDPRHLQRAQNEVAQLGGRIELITIPAFRFNDICAQHNINHIDFLTIDTEGSEERIIRSIDFDAITISVIAVENNYREPAIRNYLQSHGYIFLCTIAGDDVYLKSGIFI